MTTVAGTGEHGYFGDGEAAAAAGLWDPTGVFVADTGIIYIADFANNRIRMVNASGIITTIAGTAAGGYSGDGGPATSAELYGPMDLTLDGLGNLFIVDKGNHRVRRVNPSGIITTVAGTGMHGYAGDGGPATEAQLWDPTGIAVAASGDLFIADFGNNRIRKVDSSGTITTVAGTATAGYSGDGGPATSAELYGPMDLALDGTGNLFIVDKANHRVRKVDSSGTITTVAGTGNHGYAGDGGLATEAQLWDPTGVFVASSGDLYVADFADNRVRRIDSSGTITTVAGTGQGGYSGDGDPAPSSDLCGPRDIFVDDFGTVYIVDKANHRIRKVRASAPPSLMVHYMPWFQTPEVQGYWGWHWTMDNRDPDIIDVSGHRQIASHYYPLTGPYDSSDEDLLEYQTLLMKLSGIDGVIVDWGSYEDLFDWKRNHDSTVDIFEAVTRAGLKFALCYEDVTIKMMVENDYLEAGEAHTYGRDVMAFVEDSWFDVDSYLRLSGRPVLLNSGPQQFTQSADWAAVFADLSSPPLFFPLHNTQPVMAGSYPWPPMWASVDDILSSESNDDYLTGFYEGAATWDYHVAGAWPGFNDFYGQGGPGFTYGYLDAQDGATLQSTLQSALNSNPDVIQLVTWNDYGEGTNIEPTVEYGFGYLEMIQQVRRASIDPSFAYGTSELAIPLRLFDLRKTYSSSAAKNESLDLAFEHILAGEFEQAVAIMDAVDTETSVEDHGSEGTPARFALEQNYPNPFNPTTAIRYQLREPASVSLVIYDLLGQKVRTLIDGQVQVSGSHEVVWDGSSDARAPAASGIFILRLEAGDYTGERKMLLVR